MNILPARRLTPLALLFSLLAEPASAAPRLHASLAAGFAYGQSYSKNRTSVPRRTMLVPGFGAALGLRFGFLLAGLAGEYAWWRQQTDPGELSGSNLQGTMLLLTPLLGLELGRLSLLARARPLLARYELARPDASGRKQTYSSATLLGLELRLRAAQGASILGFTYQRAEFANVSRDGRDVALASGSEAGFHSFGLLYGLQF